MPMEIECQECGRKLHVREEYAGKRVKCPNCQAIIHITTPAHVSAFDSPEGGSAEAPSVGSPQIGVTPRMRSALAQTWPWTLFLAIVTLLGGGFLLIGALGGLAFAVRDVDPLYVFLAVFWLVLSVPLLIGSYYLFRYAGQIRAFLRTSRIEYLENALIAHKSFWKLAGVMAVIVLAIQVVLFVFASLS